MQAGELRRLSVFISAVFVATAAIAQNACDDNYRAIEKSIKRIAAYDRAGIPGDNYAPRETNRLLLINNEMLSINAQLQLVALKKCPAPSNSLDPEAYYADANRCMADRARASSNRSPASCDIQSWKRD